MSPRGVGIHMVLLVLRARWPQKSSPFEHAVGFTGPEVDLHCRVERVLFRGRKENNTKELMEENSGCTREEAVVRKKGI